MNISTQISVRPDFMLILLIVMPALVVAQAQKTSGRSIMKSYHHETVDQPLVHVNSSSMPTSSAYRINIPGFTSVQVNVNSSGQNIVGDAANEPTIAIDPVNPNRMVIGWRQFNTISSNFRQAGYAYTTNGGQTWNFPGVLEPGVFRSDPVLDSDSEGNFYYNSLTSTIDEFSCKVFRSSTGGVLWDEGVSAHGGDKQWMVIDKTGSIGNGNVYASWTSGYSNCLPGFFTRSVDAGSFFEDCEIIPEDPYWGTLATGPDGELYVGGVAGLQSSGFVVAKSTTARDSDTFPVWDTTALVSLDGDLSARTGPNPAGLLGQTCIAVDNSTGSGRGNVYLLASVNRSSNPDPLDVMFSRSTDGGLTWDDPVRINNDASQTNWQWFGTMSVAPNGRIDVIWLDTRDNPGTYLSSLYYSYSVDQGQSWSDNFRLSDSFNPHLGWPKQNKMGDYYHMISDSNDAHLAWAATFGGEQNVYYGHITFPVIGIGDHSDNLFPGDFRLLQNYPNPFNPSTTLSFRLPEQKHVKLSVYNCLGQKVKVLINDLMPAGLHHICWNADDMASGIYLCKLEAGSFYAVKKMTLVK